MILEVMVALNIMVVCASVRVVVVNISMLFGEVEIEDNKV